MSDELNKAIAYYNADNLSRAKTSLKKVKSNSYAKKKLEYGILIKEKKYKQSVFLGKQLLLETKSSKEIVDVANNMARCYFAENDGENAEHYFELSLAHDDSVANAPSIIYLLKLYALREHFVNIEKLAPKALGWDKYSIDAQLLLLESASKRGKKTLVLQRVERILQDFDELDKEQFNIVLEYLHNVNMQDLIDIACERYEKRFNKIILSNKVDYLLKHNRVDDALALLEKNTIDVIANNYLLGNTLHEKGDYNGAFDAWEKGGEIHKRDNPMINKYRNVNLRMFNDYRNIIPKLQKKTNAFEDDEGQNHVFIVGFPRSGTTLLDNILDTQDELLVLSERKILLHAEKIIKKFGKKTPKDIPNLTADELDKLRRRYTEIIVDEQGFQLPDSGKIVEKNPHATNQIPLIKSLYPKSKLIVSIRHPLDVCISCLQQNFVINSYTSHLLVFNDIVNHYIAVFELLERYEMELGIEVLYVRYEDLVDDLEAEMKKIYDYIDFIPNDSYLKFHKHANNKFVTSASRGQTNQPLYQSSKYKWKKYKDRVEPYIDKLSYFIDKFGYV